MKKTPIITGLVGIVVLGAAYVGGVSISSHKAMDKLRNWVAVVNQRPTTHVDIADEHPGWFSSDAHLIVSDPSLPAFKLDSQLTFHHGIWRTDITGNTAIVAGNSAPASAKPQRISGPDVAGRIHNFSNQGNRLQLTYQLPESDQPTAGKNDRHLSNKKVEFITEFGVSLTATERQHIETLIAKGRGNGQPIPLTGEAVTARAQLVLSQGDKERTTFDMPLLSLWQDNVRHTSGFVTVDHNGEDVLTAQGLTAIDLTVQDRPDNPWEGFFRLALMGELKLDQNGGQQRLKDAEVIFDGSEAQWLMQFKAAQFSGTDKQQGTFRFDTPTFAIRYGQSFIDELKPLVPADPYAWTLEHYTLLSSKLRTYFPDLHFATGNVEFPDSYAPGQQIRWASTNLDIQRDSAHSVTHLNSHSGGVTTSDYDKADLTVRTTLDQSVIDTLFETFVSMKADVADFDPDVAEARVVYMLQKAPRLLLDELHFTGLMQGQPVDIQATGELSVDGQHIDSLAEMAPTLFNGHVTISKLPDAVVEQARQHGIPGIRKGEATHVVLANGQLTFNGQRVF